MNETPAAPPRIFTPARRSQVRERMGRLQQHADAPAYLAQDMAEDAMERIDFVRHTPQTALLIGDSTGTLGRWLTDRGTQVTHRDPVLGAQPLDEERPFSAGQYDLIASLGTLDTVNDLPGALIHIRAALKPGGLAIISFPGAGSLSALRGIMLAADGDRPAARMHPLVDVKAGAQLLQRAGFAHPVADSHTVRVRYSSLRGLVADIRAMGLGNALADRAPPLTRLGLAQAEAAFAAQADANGKLAEQFEILTLTGWRR